IEIVQSGASGLELVEQHRGGRRAFDGQLREVLGELFFQPDGVFTRAPPLVDAIAQCREQLVEVLGLPHEDRMYFLFSGPPRTGLLRALFPSVASLSPRSAESSGALPTH